MSGIGVRLLLLLVVSAVVALVVVAGKYFVALKRRQALAAAPFSVVGGHEPITGDSETQDTDGSVARTSPIRILAFSTEDCRQCKQLQAPALERVLAERQGSVVVTDVDAVVEHELTQTYHVLTVPSTVVLDGQGQAQAVNYGFANAQRLLTQIDQILERVS